MKLLSTLIKHLMILMLSLSMILITITRCSRAWMLQRDDYEAVML
jgi:hypothetical protein